MAEQNVKSKSSGFAVWAKERVRKVLVAIKRNPQAVPLIALVIAFVPKLASIPLNTVKPSPALFVLFSVSSNSFPKLSSSLVVLFTSACAWFAARPCGRATDRTDRNAYGHARHGLGVRTKRGFERTKRSFGR